MRELSWATTPAGKANFIASTIQTHTAAHRPVFERHLAGRTFTPRRAVIRAAPGTNPPSPGRWNRLLQQIPTHLPIRAPGNTPTPGDATGPTRRQPAHPLGALPWELRPPGTPISAACSSVDPPASCLRSGTPGSTAVTNQQSSPTRWACRIPGRDLLHVHGSAAGRAYRP